MMSVSRKPCWVCACESKRNSLLLSLLPALWATKDAAPCYRLATESEIASWGWLQPHGPSHPYSPSEPQHQCHQELSACWLRPPACSCSCACVERDAACLSPSQSRTSHAGTPLAGICLACCYMPPTVRMPRCLQLFSPVSTSSGFAAPNLHLLAVAEACFTPDPH